MAEQEEINLPDLEGRPSRRKQTKKKDLQKDGDKIVVQYNTYGVPIGQGRNELRNYIGVIVRETVSIIYDDWRRVPLEVKEFLWQHFQKKFALSLKMKGQVLKMMGVSLRNFRSELANEFIIPNKNDMKSLRSPPIEYPSIKDADWKLFVNKVLSEDFQAKSQQAKEKRAKNTYNHHLGSTGYSGMLYRHKLKTGISEKEIDRSDAWIMARKDKDGNLQPAVAVIETKISDLKSQVEEGSFQSQGPKDILTEAIQKQPNGSRVQGLGQFITPSMYFQIPESSEFAMERKKYQESFQFMTMQLEYMNARLNAYSNTEVGSSNFPKAKSSSGACLEAEKSPSIAGKRKVDLVVGKCSPKSVKNKTLKGPTEVGVPNDDQKEQNIEATSRITPVKPKMTPRRSPRLTPKAKAEGVQLLCTKEPKNELVVKKQIARKLVLKKNTRAAVMKRKEDKSPYMQMFFMVVKNCLPELIKIDFDVAIFGVTWESYLDKAICEEIMDFKEVSNCAINIWMKHLYDEMDKTETAKPVQFGNSESLRPSKVVFKKGPEYISKLLGLIELGQIILIPYNPSFHWVLLAIDMVRRTIFYLDPKGNNPTDELMKIVNQGIRVHQSLQSNKKSGSVTWVSVKCPIQPGNFECGYYVMKYMQQIVTNVNILKENFKGVNEYTVQDISQLRDDWAIYVSQLITNYNEENINYKNSPTIVR